MSFHLLGLWQHISAVRKRLDFRMITSYSHSIVYGSKDGPLSLIDDGHLLPPLALRGWPPCRCDHKSASTMRIDAS